MLQNVFVLLTNQDFDNFSVVITSYLWSLLRVLLDRAHTDIDDVFQSLDSEPQPLTSPLPSSPLRNSNTSTSETNTSDPTSSCRPPPSSSSAPSPSPTSVDLNRILLNIKSCRWRHFRPRTLSSHPLGGGDLSRRGFRVFSRSASGLSRNAAGGAGSRTGPAPAPVNCKSAASFTVLESVYLFFDRVTPVL